MGEGFESCAVSGGKVEPGLYHSAGTLYVSLFGIWCTSEAIKKKLVIGSEMDLEKTDHPSPLMRPGWNQVSGHL